MSHSPGLAADGHTRATTTVLARTCRAEWSRLWTVRSSWLFALATAVAVLGIGTILGIDVHGDPRSEQPTGTAWLGGQITAMFGLFGLLALALISATSDHGTGGIVPTLQATPRRGILFAARTGVVATTMLVFGLALVAGASLIIYALAPEMGLPADVGVDTLARVALVFGAGSLLAVGTGLLTRSIAGGLVTVLALMLVLPMMLAIFPFDWSRQLAELMPGTGAMYLLMEEAAVPVTEAGAKTTLTVWALAALAAGGYRLLRHDADR